jgi:hypothetical protein
VVERGVAAQGVQQTVCSPSSVVVPFDAATGAQERWLAVVTPVTITPPKAERSVELQLGWTTVPLELQPPSAGNASTRGVPEQLPVPVWLQEQEQVRALSSKPV